MSGESPAAVLFDENGVALAVEDEVLLPDGTRALLIAADGPNGNARFLRVNASGELAVSGNETVLAAINENLEKIVELLSSMGDE